MKNIILDTNFLVYCAKQKIDYVVELDKLIRGGYQLAVVSDTLEELRLLQEKSKKYSDKQAACLACTLLKQNKFKIIGTITGNADGAILKQIKKSKEKDIVATLDKELLKKIKNAIIIRGKRKLVFR